MLSRVADSIYWLARYVERAENLSRLLLSTQDLLLDAGSEGSDSSEFWGPILVATGDDEAYSKLHSQITGKAVVEFLTAHPANPNSIANCVRAARENARTIRDQISDELWECVNSMKLYVDSNREVRHSGVAFFERILSGSYEFQGIAASTTPRGENWHFLRLGTCLERADQMSRLIDTCSPLSMEMPPHPESKPLRWAALLRSCSAWHAFQVHSARLDPRRVIEYLLMKDEFPRSVACCVTEVHRILLVLSDERGETMPEHVRLAGRLRADLAYSHIDEIIEKGLHDSMDDLQTRLIDIGRSIFEAFVLHADLLPVAEEAVPTPPAPTAWHAHHDSELEMQQQQQQ